MASQPELEERRRRTAAARALLGLGKGRVHLVGVGGVGMAGLAVHLVARGFTVSGCDAVVSRITEWLAARGIAVQSGHDPSHAAGADWLVRTPAVAADHAELGAARARGLPVFDRGEVLPALLDGRTSVAVSGTHGKTTTAAMTAQVLEAAELRPGFCIGGEVTALGGVAGAGEGKYLVVEADESDGTVALYQPTVAIITNVEYDHMENFDNPQDLFSCFDAFARGAQQVIYGRDDARAARIGGAARGAWGYGFSDDADIRAVEVEESGDSIAFGVVARGRQLGRVVLPVAGRHNAQNALGACAAALALGVPFGEIRQGLERFVPARRRFEKTYDGRIMVVSDYAHHPTEIRALVQMARGLGRRLVAVFQPHRYTRTRALGRDFPPAFEGVDEVLLVPVYEASEKRLEGGTAEDLQRHFDDSGRVTSRYLASLDKAWEYLRPRLRDGDVLLVVGAGDVERLAFRAADHFRSQDQASGVSE